MKVGLELWFPYSFLRDPAVATRSEQQDGDGDGKTGGEEDAGENGSCKGRTRWSQVVARVRLAGGARLAAQKRFPPPKMLHLVPYLTFRPPSSPSKRSLSCKSSSRLLTPSTPSTPSTPPTPPPSTPSKRCLSCKSPSRLQKKFLSKTDSAIELVSVKVDFFQLRWKTQISILWPVCLRNLFHFYFAVCPSFSSRASARFLPAPPFQQQRTTKSSVDRAKKECGSDNKWMKTSFFPIDNMLQQNIQTSPIADYFLKGNIRVITTMPCKLVLWKRICNTVQSIVHTLFFLFWVTLLIL